MLIVAGRTRHVRGRLEAAAPFEKSHLVPVNVHNRVRREPLQCDEVRERLAGLKGKCGSDFIAKTAMALCANIDLPVAGKLGGILDGFTGGCLRTVAVHMFLAWTVASLTRNAQNKVVLLVTIPKARRSERLKVRRVTFDTARNHGPVKICRTVQISRTVDPPAKFRPVRNRELEKLISFPIKIGLPFSSGTNHDAKRLRVFFGMRRFPDNDRLIKNAILGVHSEREPRVDRRHDVFWWRELPRNGASAGKLGSTAMRRKLKRFELALMAGAADIVSDVACVSRARRRRWRNRLRQSGTGKRLLLPSLS